MQLIIIDDDFVLWLLMMPSGNLKYLYSCFTMSSVVLKAVGRLGQWYQIEQFGKPIKSDIDYCLS